MIKGIEHTGIAAKDSAKMVEWYSKHLGMKTIRDIGNGIFFIQAANGFILEIYPAKQSIAQPDNHTSGIRHLAILVENIEAERENLASEGVDIDPCPPAGAESRLVPFRDLEGNLCHLVERKNPLA